jgi:hypothetical protein
MYRGERKLSSIISGGMGAGQPEPNKENLESEVSSGTLTYKDSGLKRDTEYCYRMTSWYYCNGNGSVNAGEESAVSAAACAIAK